MTAQRGLLTLTVLLGTLVQPLPAVINRWDNGQVIPGTLGITPGPGVVLDHWQLEYALLSFTNLTGSRFDFSNLTNANLGYSTLTNANLTGAVVSGADFRRGWNGTSYLGTGLTSTQLVSTASYQAKDLHGIGFGGNDLSGWDLSGQNLTNAKLDNSTLTTANLTGAGVTGASFWDTTSRGFTHAQLASTASYQAKDLHGIGLGWDDLSGWDFSGQDLTNAKLAHSTLTNLNLSGAVVAGASFSNAVGFIYAQLQSTASYQAKDLHGIGLGGHDLSGWDLSGQDLTNASFVWRDQQDHPYGNDLTNANLARANLTNASLLNSTLTNVNLTGANLTSADLWGSTLTNANLTGANLTSVRLRRTALTNANLAGALVTGVDFSDTTSRGFTQAQLQSTASYQAKDLHGIELSYNDLTGWDFSGQNLTNAELSWVSAPNWNLTGADLRGAIIVDGDPLSNGITKNTIGQWGEVIGGVNLANGDRLVVRNYLGDPSQGLDPIPLFADRMTMEGGGVLQIKFDTDHWYSLISFQPGIPVELGGTLELNFTDDIDVATQVGRTLHIFDWTGVNPTGQFHVTASQAWDLSKLYTTGEVRLIAVPGDFDGDSQLTVADINVMADAVRTANQDSKFDLSGDGTVDLADHAYWVHTVKHTSLGDANLDGEFNSGDLVQVFQNGQYEDTFASNSTWSTGDWNADGEFTTSDLVAAFQDGGYEQGQRAAPRAVPETSSQIMLVIGLMSIAIRRTELPWITTRS